ncbi:MAG TPA: DUF4097 family beta strand repeat-containing protein [Candidatus Krumholzibacteria bacterium]|nr:DUF4097 family beta strand repeat-containing protein [Candidatus Krumholzibacteria bacterium]
MSYKHRVGACAGVLGLLLVARGGGPAWASPEEWSFTGVERIEIKGVSGDVVVRPATGKQVEVKLVAHVVPSDAFEPRVEQSGTSLRIDERWHGGSSSGSVEWTVLVPKGAADLRLAMDTASGDLDVEGIAARIDLDTASGDIICTDVQLGNSSDLSTASGDFTFKRVTLGSNCDLTTASGDFEFTDVDLGEGCDISTASGSIEVVGCKGEMELSTASGDVVVENCQIEGRGEFSSASGDVRVRLDKLPAEELSASSASGDVSLKVADYGANFTLTLVKREDRGDIVCPFKFTSERTYEDHHVYEEKVVQRGTGGPEVWLKTASGSVIVRK